MTTTDTVEVERLSSDGFTGTGTSGLHREPAPHQHWALVITVFAGQEST